MPQIFSNNAFGSLGATLSAVATSLTLATGQGVRFPSPTGGDHFLLTLIGLDGNGNENAWEIVRVTARSTDTLTVTRAQESTTAALWVAGTRVELRATKGTFDNLLQLTGGTVTGPVTLMNGAYTALKVGLTGLVSIGGEAGSADSRFTITNGGAEGLEFSQTAIAGQNRILSYNRAGAAFVPLSLSASEVRFNISGTDSVIINGSGVSGITKAMVGLGNVDNTSNATERAATATLTNKTISGGVYTGVIDQTGSVRGEITAVGALDINCSTTNYFTKTINGASTFTFSSVPASRAYSFTLELTHTSGAVTWPASVQWPNATAPSLTTGKTHLFMFVTDDGGTRWRGAALTNYTT